MERDQYSYTEAAEPELNELVVGRRAGHAVHLYGSIPASRLRSGVTGVVWREPSRSDGVVQPIVLVAREEDQKRLCGRFAQLRSDLSPLTTWAHLLRPEHFELVRGLTREADLNGYQAAWTGLAVAEALLLSERPIAQLRVAACFATQTFAVARGKALWDRVPTSEIAERFDLANRLFRHSELRHARLRAVLEPIWTVLSTAASSDLHGRHAELAPLVSSLRRLRDFRERIRDHQSAQREEDAWYFVEPLRELAPEAQIFTHLSKMAPEQRLKQFDKLVLALNEHETEAAGPRRGSLAFLAGYLATVAAGGAPSLSIAEVHSNQLPEITAWAYVLGGVGEPVIWTSSFDGLGKLVARELMRPLRLDDAPTCDVALDEAKVLVDPQLSDPFVHLRLKQSRLVTISLLPGVNIAVPLTEAATAQEPARAENTRNVSTDARPRIRSNEDAVANLAHLLWPYLEPLIDKMRYQSQVTSNYQARDKRNRNRSRGSQSGLPLEREDEAER